MLIPPTPLIIKTCSSRLSYTAKNSFWACLPTFKDDPFFIPGLISKSIKK